MTTQHAWSLLACCLVGGLAVGQPGEPGTAPTVLIDSTGKETKLFDARFTSGVRRLVWLADSKGQTEDGKRGPLALELREPHSTTYQKGVVTLVPTTSVMVIRYEYERQEMSVAVRGLPEPLKGTLQYRGINVFGLEGRAAGGEPRKFTGGLAKDGFRSVTFPDAKPLPTQPPGGTAWSVQIDHARAGHPTVEVRNLRALYSYPGGVEALNDTLPVRKNPQEFVVLAPGLKRLEMVAVDQNKQVAVVEITTDRTAVDKLIAIPLLREQDGRTGVLTGLVGEVDAGWKLFPLHAIKTIQQKPSTP